MNFTATLCRFSPYPLEDGQIRFLDHQGLRSGTGEVTEFRDQEVIHMATLIDARPGGLAPHENHPF